MTDRTEFNLDELLGEKDVRHYLRFIQGGGREFVVSAIGGRVEMPSMRRSVHFEAIGDEDVERESWIPAYSSLSLIGDGPDWCSSSAGLALSPEFCWDVCGYYAILGVSWKATRRELMEGAIAHGGADDYDVNYAIRQLLDEDIRYVYDRIPLGGIFIADRRTQEMLKRHATLMAARAAAAGEDTTVEDVLDRMGLSLKPDLKSEKDSAAEERRRVMLPPSAPLPPEPSTTLGSSIPEWDRHWSFWARGRAPRESGDLPRWQLLLGAEFRARGMRMRFSVGITSGAGFSADARTSEGCPIILLGTEPPSPDLARRAVREIMAYQTGASRWQY